MSKPQTRFLGEPRDLNHGGGLASFTFTQPTHSPTAHTQADSRGADTVPPDLDQLVGHEPGFSNGSSPTTKGESLLLAF